MKTGWGWKKQAKAMIPKRVLNRITELRFRRMNRRVDAAFAGDDAVQVFSNVYKSGIWGRKSGTDFYSGGGSHDPHLVDPYVKAVVGFLSSLSSKPSVVDLGCGDFNVGSQIRPSCDRYIACDVVPDLIDHNRTAFCDLDVDFRCLNAVLDDLPDADVVFLRQVLQHLSNDQIGKVLPKLQRYRYLVLSESLPVKPGFLPNLEKQTGPGMRVASRSGVVITEPPFSLPFVAEQDICLAVNQATLIRTTVYQLH
jgi:SAM-dependent methyltransferase